jgi:hypothetical protein
MPRRDRYDDDDRDDPQDIDLNWPDEEDEAVSCLFCGKSVHEDAALCPHCGQWILAEGAAGRRARGWFWPVMVAILLAMILVMWHGLGR